MTPLGLELLCCCPAGQAAKLHADGGGSKHAVGEGVAHGVAAGAAAAARLFYFRPEDAAGPRPAGAALHTQPFVGAKHSRQQQQSTAPYIRPTAPQLRVSGTYSLQQPYRCISPCSQCAQQSAAGDAGLLPLLFQPILLQLDGLPVGAADLHGAHRLRTVAVRQRQQPGARQPGQDGRPGPPRHAGRAHPHPLRRASAKGMPLKA